MRTATVALLALLPLALGCGPDLPQDWIGAELVETLDQSACETEDPYEGHMEDITAEGREGAVDVTYLGAHFRCSQEVEAYWMHDAHEIQVLVQPVEMDPDTVAGCDCLYEIWLRVEPIEADTWQISLWRRWDNQNDPNDPVAIGTESVVVQ